MPILRGAQVDLSIYFSLLFYYPFFRAPIFLRRLLSRSKPRSLRFYRHDSTSRKPSVPRIRLHALCPAGLNVLSLSPAPDEAISLSLARILLDPPRRILADNRKMLYTQAVDVAPAAVLALAPSLARTLCLSRRCLLAMNVHFSTTARSISYPLLFRI